MKLKLSSISITLSSSYQIEVRIKDTNSDGDLRKPIKPKHVAKLLTKQFPNSKFMVKFKDTGKPIPSIKYLGLFRMDVALVSTGRIQYVDDQFKDDIALWIVPE